MIQKAYGMGLACRNMFQPASCCIGLPGTAAWRGSVGLDSAWERKMGFDRFGISGTGEIWCIWPFIFVPWKLLKAFQGCKQHWGLESDSPRSASVPPSSCELNLPQGADLGMVRADLLRAEACAWPQGAWSVGILFLKQNTLNQCAGALLNHVNMWKKHGCGSVRKWSEMVIHILWLYLWLFM